MSNLIGKLKKEESELFWLVIVMLLVMGAFV